MQLIFEGRGVKLYFEPAFPKLFGRMGVGSKVKNLEKYCKLENDVHIEINKLGNLAVVSGPNKERVANVACRLFWKLKQGVFTGKGAKIAFNKVKRKVVKKK